MTEETGAAAPAETATETPVVAGEQAATTPQEQPNQEASQEVETTDGQEDQSSEPKKLSRNQRLQRKAARLSTMVAEQQAEIERLRQASAAIESSEPKEADYNGDWTKYQADYAAWKTAKSFKETLNERDQREAEARLKDRMREAAEEFGDRAAEYKASVADFDTVIEAFAKSGGSFSNDLQQELLESEQGPALAYHIAKSPGLANELNGMSTREVAREIGRLEAKLTGPQPKKQTQAPKPLAPITGGTASPAKDPAKMSTAEYVAWRKSGGGGKPAF